MQSTILKYVICVKKSLLLKWIRDVEKNSTLIFEEDQSYYVTPQINNDLNLLWCV